MSDLIRQRRMQNECKDRTLTYTDHARLVRQDKRTDGRWYIFFNNYNKKPTSTDAKHDGVVPYTMEARKCTTSGYRIHQIITETISNPIPGAPDSHGRAPSFVRNLLGFAAHKTPNFAQKVNAKDRPNTVLSSRRWHLFGIQFVQTQFLPCTFDPDWATILQISSRYFFSLGLVACRR